MMHKPARGPGAGLHVGGAQGRAGQDVLLERQAEGQNVRLEPSGRMGGAQGRSGQDVLLERHAEDQDIQPRRLLKS